ncbi:MAG: enoyl-CoA hydratase [Mycobacteriaceae bacterium]|nr:enoyl-CoA hydratase [Mycobacteriaceae bacterium]
MTTVDSSTQAYPIVDGLSVELAHGVLSITMNRPDSLNSLTGALLAGIADSVQRAASDERVRVLRLQGAGRGFSSGAGISAEDQKVSRAGSPTDVIDEANRVVRAIVALPKPAVAVVQGPAAGLGVSLAIACDVVLASENAFFMLAFTKIGLMPDGGASALVAAAVGRSRAMRMALLAERISAHDAFDWGLVTAVYPAENFSAEVDKVVASLVKGPAVALRKTKDAINATTLTELDEALERERTGQAALITSNDFREGALAFQQRRPAEFTDG